MADHSSLWVNAGGVEVINPGNTLLSPLGTSALLSLNGIQADETYHVKIYDAGVITHLGFHVITNPFTIFGGATITATLMKNGIATALSVSAGPGVTGFLLNSTDIVSVVPGDTIHVRYTHNNVFEFNGTGNMTSAIFTPDDTGITVTQVFTEQTSAFIGIGFNTTRYVALHGVHGEGSGTQQERQDCIPIDCVAKHARIRIIANSCNGATTCVLQKNGIDTAITITFNVGENGWKEEAVPANVTFAAHDVAGWRISVGGSSGGITFIGASLQFHSANKEWFVGVGQQARVPPGTTTVNGIAGDNVASSEADAQWSATLAGRCLGLCINIRVNNNLVGDTTLTFRKDGLDGAAVVTVPATATGFFDDPGPDVWEVGDLINVRLVSPGGGTIVYSTIDWVGSFFFPPPPPVCPGDTGDPRMDGLPYVPPPYDACAGSGTTGGSRTGM